MPSPPRTGRSPSPQVGPKGNEPHRYAHAPRGRRSPDRRGARRPALWLSDNIEIELGEGTDFAWVAFRNRRKDAELCDMCFLGTFAQKWRDGPFRTYIGQCRGRGLGREVGCAIPAGVSELYFMGDGPFRVTIELDELEGAQTLTAAGEVDGSVERVPAKCVTPDCALLSGSAVRTIGRGRPAMAQIQTYVEARRADTNPTVQNVTACAYPGYFTEEKSPDPADHPLGCDVADPDDTSSEEFLFPFVANSGGLGGVGMSGKTHGDQYLGFTIHHREAVPPVTIDAFAMWLDAGIR